MGEPLRTLLVAGPATGGLRGHLQALASGLGRRGVAVTVLAPPVTLERLDPDLVHVAPGPVGSLRPGAALASRRRLRALAAQADVVHAHGLRAGALAAWAGARPLVLTWHNAPIGGPVGRRAHALAERFQARRADLVLAVSPDLGERARRAGAARVRLIEVPAPESGATTADPATVRAALGLPPGQPLVLGVGRLEAQKRWDVLVDAASGWGRDGPAVVIAGSGRQRRRLERRIRRQGAPVQLVGHRGDVADLLRAAAVLVVPSRWEGWPLTVVEAMRAGVPVVAASSPGVDRQTAGAASLVPIGDAAALRNAVEQVLSSAAVRDRLRGAGRARASEWQTVGESVDDTVSIYLDLVQRSSL